MQQMHVRLQQIYVKHPADGTSSPSAGIAEASQTTQQFALCDINIDIAQGEQIAIIGPSGAGKTTLLHTLACAIRPSSGGFFMDGISPWQLSHKARHRLRRRLFLAPQTPPLPPRQRVVTTVLAGNLPHWSIAKALRNLVKPIDPAAAFHALSRFHLEDKLYVRVDQLSGGERQRCGLARLLLSDAHLLLVDEPLSALDPLLASQTLETLQQEARERNASLICSLHHVELARSNFTRIIGLRDGQIFFDSKHVNDQMIADLYQNASSKISAATGSPTLSNADADAIAVAPRCF